MREMKDSGIQWVGKVPPNWEIMPNKYLMHKVKKICPVYNGENILSLTMQGVIIRDFDLGGKMPATFDGYQIIYPGNLLMCLFDYDVTPRCIGLIKDKGLTSPAYSQFVMNQGADARYYYYYYLLLDFTKELLHLAKNLRHSFTEEQLGKIKVPVPPIGEQHRIADFLDTRCSQMDSIRKNVEAEIETLKQYKKSVITEAVTKGLDKNVEMKESGIPWNGKIPKDWQLTRIKYTCNSRSEKAFFNHKYNKYLGLENVVGFSNEIIDTNASYADGYYDIYKYGDVLFSKLRPYLGKVLIATQDGFCTGEFIRLFNYHGDRRFLRYWMMNNQFINEVNNSTYGTKMPRANPEFIMNMPIPALLYKIQHRIADYLDTKCARIDSIIQKKQELLANLDTYKKALIYEYVTGKKEVPAV